ncbi:uncharacterized protein B0P05DRAFT_554509 [Gilbertella persicaria]|uniref:uncharacterized protein n=1 Tax=Gilbertella persicaria TaxID=101096 RepID=UPI00221F8AF9|nr:uncharacterized protein B0P05DRAFT_554509 [Gilbertella persicaria]KAI8064832.1 hypothetical protein B0P05DRAFT_554509 [Gilbertella persicaria]
METIQQENNYQNKVSPFDEKTEQPNTKITAGQTGLPWLTHDADAEGFNEASSSSPPPKFMAKPKATSLVRLPTRKRTMQKHIYSMREGLNPVKTLCSRLLSWQISVKYLLSMFQRIKKVESATGKGYRKIDTKSTIPSKIQNQFKSSDGVQDAWTAFRQFTRENSLIHQDFVDFIENEIKPTLHVMLKDIKDMTQTLKHDKKLHTATLWNCRKRADKVITRLNADIYNTQKTLEKVKGPYVIPKRDPLLTKYVVIRTVRNLYQHENQLHKDFLETQDKYRQFEQEKIISAYTQLFQSFETYRINHHLENLEGVNKVAAIFNAIENDAEWVDFFNHHDNELVKPKAAYKSEQEPDFPNASHPLVQPLAISTLQKHHSKKWTDAFYVLSPVGLLYRYKSEKDLLQSPFKPDMTMFIPKCAILISSNKDLLQLEGKPLKGLFASKRIVQLSSTDPALIRHWIDLMSPMAIQQETAVIDVHPPPQQEATHPPPQQEITQQETIPLEQDARSMHSKVQDENDVKDAKLTNAGDTSAAADESRSVVESINNNASQGHVSEPADDRDQEIEHQVHVRTPTAEVLYDTKGGQTNDRMPGPTREGSELYWDTTS